MTKLVWIFGSIAGLICGAMFFLNHPDEGGEISAYGELIGYVTMIVALAPIFFAVKQYRDQQLNGSIRFGKAFLVGLYITLIASTIYVLAWEVYYLNYGQDFGEIYVEYQRKQMTDQGLSEDQITETLASQQSMMDMYKENRAFRMGVTFTEIFPVGLTISLICGLIFGVFMRKPDPEMVSS